MDATSELTQLDKRLLECSDVCAEHRCGSLVSVLSRFSPRSLESKQQRHELLLCTVVKVSLYLLPFPLPGLDQASARLAHLFQLSLQLRLQASVLQGHPHGRGRRFNQLRLMPQRRVVYKRRDWTRRTIQDARGTLRDGPRELNAPSVEVGERFECGHPIGDFERRIV